MTSTLTRRPKSKPKPPAANSGWFPRRWASLWSAITGRQSRLILTILVVLVAAFAVWAVFFSTIFAARTVQVFGNHQVTDAEVLSAAAVPTTVPLLRVSLSDIAARVEQLDAVSTATVERDWPTGIRITVTERKPVAQIATTDGFGVLGSDGSLYRTEQQPVRGLPTLDGPWPPSTDGTPVTDVQNVADTTRTAFVVAAGLPRSMRPVVTDINAADPQRIVLTLRSGDVVNWGTDALSDRKGEVLALLIHHPASTYDVSVPDAPTWRS